MGVENPRNEKSQADLHRELLEIHRGDGKGNRWVGFPVAATTRLTPEHIESARSSLNVSVRSEEASGGTARK